MNHISPQCITISTAVENAVMIISFEIDVCVALRDCSEFLVRGGWSFSVKVPIKNAYPPPRSLRKILVPHLGVSVKNGYRYPFLTRWMDGMG